jgi:8-amino-7-oxononanoate synthase
MDELVQTLEHLEREGLLRTPRSLEGAQGPLISIGGRKLINLCSNDYLGLAAHPSVIEGAIEAARRFGAGSGSSRLVAGTLQIHLDFERELARFKGFEAALVMSTGYMANLGVLQSLAGPDDAIFSDVLNHASLIDGCRLSRAAVHVYPHRDTSALEEMLQKAKGFRRRLIITESVFSMDGDIAPLPALVELKERFGTLLVVDEAHATGVLGKSGKGALEHFGLQGGVDVLIGTLGKALGSFGAFVCSSRSIREYLINTARAFIFTTGLPPSAVGAAYAALELIQQHPERIKGLWQNANLLKSGLAGLGWSLQSETPILPLILGKATHALAFGNALFQAGVFIAPIRPPSVPEGSSRLRITPTAAHTTPQLQSALEAFSLCGKALGLLS